MLRNILLKQKLKIALLKTRKETVPLSYNKAHKIGLIIDNNLNNSQGIRYLINKLIEEGKHIETLCFNEMAEALPLNVTQKTLTKKDINWLGRFKKYDIKKFIRTDFDYIFSLCSKTALPIENILANCKAKCRIGLFTDARKDLFDLIIKPTSSHFDNQAVNDMLFYLKKINN